MECGVAFFAKVVYDFYCLEIIDAYLLITSFLPSYKVWSLVVSSLLHNYST